MGLTKEEVLAMEPQELSLAIADRIFQAEIISKEDEPELKLLIGYFGKQAWRPINHSWHNAKWRNSEEQAWLDCPRYAEDISAAWEVTRIMKDKNWWIVLNSEGESWNAMYYWDPNQTGYEADAETAPLAICRAALLSTLSE